MRHFSGVDKRVLQSVKMKVLIFSKLGVGDFTLYSHILNS